MGTEIERKFLVRGEAWRAAATERTSFRQGYLAVDHGNTVRIRLAGDQAWLTVKGPATGARRTEFEYAVPPDDALVLLELCGPRVVEKTRSRVPAGRHTWEVDEFSGRNAGLTLAEIEVDSETETVRVPDWIGREVTGERRFDNASLSARPYADWPLAERSMTAG